MGIDTVTYTYTDHNNGVNELEINIVVNAIPIVAIDLAGPYCIENNEEDLSGNHAGGL